MSKWKEGPYSISELELGHGLKLSVNYESIYRIEYGDPHWNVYVFGNKLMGRENSAEEAKARAEKVALKWLNDAIEVLQNARIPD